MKAEERKEIETNSLVLAVQKWKKQLSGRVLYYIVGTILLIVVGWLIYRYFSKERLKARDAIQFQILNADTPEKLKQGSEENRGTIDGAQFKLHLARRLLKEEGLPKLGTDRAESRRLAANAVSDARGYFLELTSEFKEKDQAGLLQESWFSAAKAEESLIGLPTTDGGTDSRGDIDKAIEYYEKAAAIFADKDFSKSYKDWAEKLKANKAQFVQNQRELYKIRELSTFSPGKNDPFAPTPGGPKFDPSGPLFPPDPPKLPPVIDPKKETPVPSLPPTTDPKADPKTPEPKPSIPPKIELPAIPKPPESDPKVTDPKKTDTPKLDPKAK